MEEPHKDIRDYFTELDQGQQALDLYGDEHAIAERIGAIIGHILEKDSNYNPTQGDAVEQMAFNFSSSYPKDSSVWGTHYGPMFMCPDEQGKMDTYPNIHRLNESILQYWAQRARAAIHPILSARYADLVLDFWPRVVKNKLHSEFYINLVNTVINSNIAICQQKLVNPYDCSGKVKRALILAIKTKNQDTIAKVKDVIISFEKVAVEAGIPRLRGTSFDWLILDYEKKVKLSQQEKAGLIDDMQEKLKETKGNFISTKGAAFPLAEYYARKKEEDNLVSVMDVLEESLEADEGACSNTLLKVSAYGDIYDKYCEFRDQGCKRAKDESKRVLGIISKLDPDWGKSYRTLYEITDITQEEVAILSKDLYGDGEQSELPTTIANIATRFVITEEAVARQLRSDFAQNPISFAFKQKVVNDDHVLMAVLPSLDTFPELDTLPKSHKDYAKRQENYHNHVQRHALLFVQRDASSLAWGMRELKRRISISGITEYFKNSTLFRVESKEYLGRALAAYWENDYLVSSHLFIPLIERVIRGLVNDGGGKVLTSNDFRGSDYHALGYLLDEYIDIIKNAFLGQGQDIVFYFQLVLTGKYGLILRNDCAHGIDPNKFHKEAVSDRLFHLILCLSLVKHTGEETSQD